MCPELQLGSRHHPVGNTATRVVRRNPIPNVVRGAPRSHLLSSVLTVQPFAGCSRDPFMAHATADTRLSALDLATPAVAVDTQQAISVRGGVLAQYGERRRIKRGWRTGARGGRATLRSGAACWPKLGGIKQRVLLCHCTRTPRWRARARIVLFSRERPVSRFVQKKEKEKWGPPFLTPRLVAPTTWATISVHVVASPGSHGAEVGGLTVRSFSPKGISYL